MSNTKRNIILTGITIFFVFASYYILRISGGSEIQDDLLDYINNKFMKAHQLERQALDHYENVSGEHYVNDETLFRALSKDIIPVYKKFIHELENATPKTSAVNGIHQSYIKAANLQYDAFTGMHDALKIKDAKALAAAKNKLEESRRLFGKIRTKLARLAKKENIQIKILEDKH